MVSDTDLFISYGVLMTAALVPIYFGSYASLETPKSTRELKREAKKKKKAARKAAAATSDSDDSDDDDGWGSDSDDDDGETMTERLTSSDAWLFPVMGSAVLFGMFLVFKYINKEYVNMLLGVYFGLVGCFAVSKVFVAVTKAATPRSLWKRLPAFRFSLQQRGQGEILRARFTHVDVGLFILSAVLNGVYMVTKNWIISNLLALSLALNAISLMSLDSFRTGAIMLGGLFLYDIFWVFGTPVMVTVARNFDAPIKIVWPKNILDALAALRAGGEVPRLQMTMLGLGDIVIPGVFVALALRYDQTVAAQRTPSIGFTRSYTRFAKPYFAATLLAYVLGLATTMAVMHVFKAAQPALLYLSPACVGAIAITSLVRGEFKEVWAWTEDDGSEGEGSEGREDEKKPARSNKKKDELKKRKDK
ncbi:uncharacterized protein PFL1_04501 [Pseudozyma flocculosa PF-1]|uniref:Related to Minor histocompatibility antigen H13 n=2 Tax=Pseudozyma flocculosa TaxID=84751 RepID=A0A5C3FCU6_9BASI|nr:uncharacterized protein PFL1_04501 [Pseudozyma flocculosa PF-1]EPQ28174.1 hypothetical protein PFL1_04501 [Pseudozyma flocculosa PF-1]SPO41976.1 related to Minor histocompatibility antigen H13 [Pseudozyma flocculosa]